MENTVGGRYGRKRVGKGPVQDPGISSLTQGVDSQAVLDFLSAMDVARWASNPATDEDARSEASEWELRERRKREEERRVEAGLGGGG